MTQTRTPTHLIESAKSIPITETVDVCVLGGSCTGVFAAIRAARLGCKVCIIEKNNHLGGTATAGLVNVWHSLKDVDYNQDIIAGLTLETIELLQARDAIIKNSIQDPFCGYRFNSEDLKLVLDQMVYQENISVYFHTIYTAAQTNNNELSAIFIENKNGRQAISARFFIDASGDGDIARDLKLPCFRNDNMQPPTPGFKLCGDISTLNINKLLQAHSAEFGLKEDWGWYREIPNQNNIHFMAQTHVFDVDCSEARELSYAEMEGRRQICALLDILRKYAPNGHALSPVALCTCIGIRDTTHYKTSFTLKGNDLLNGTHYTDCIAYGTYPIDIHNRNSPGLTFRHLTGLEVIEPSRTAPKITRKWRTGNDYARYYEIPFRVLVPETVQNFIPVGRMINADQDAFGAVRVMVNLNQLGEAAGVAAALCVQQGITVQQLSATQLRTQMKNGGSIML